MRRFRMDKNNPPVTPENVVVLLRISEAFNNPHIQIFIDPWQLFSEGYFQIQRNDSFLAIIDDDLGASRLACQVIQPSSVEGSRCPLVPIPHLSEEEFYIGSTEKDGKVTSRNALIN